MKTIFTLFLLFINILCADDYILSETAATDMNITNPDVNGTDNSVFIEYDKNNTDTTDLRESIMVNAANKFGVFKASKDINVSDQEQMKGYIDSLRFSMPSAGNSLSSQLLSKTTNIDTNNPTNLTNQNIIKNDVNSTQSKVLNFIQPFELGVRSRIGNLKTIDCYVTRKLVNSYFCPLPSLNHSFFKGGGFKDSKAEAQDACNDLCKEPSTCLSKSMNRDIKNEGNYTDFIVDNNKSVEIVFTPGMRVKTVSLTLNSKIAYDDANYTKIIDDNGKERKQFNGYVPIKINSNDYNETKALEKLSKTSHGVAFKIDYWDSSEEKYKNYLSSIDMKIKDVISQIKLHITSLKTKKIKITFFKPWVEIKGKKEIDPNLSVMLKKTTVEYSDNKWWFCAAKNFVTSANSCDGTLKSTTVAGIVRKVCVTQANKRREPKYGAYYTKSSCSNDCYVRAKCLPTYRHLLSFNPFSLPDELKDIEIGCSSTGTNTSCTKELCKKLFLEDKMPVIEKTWTNDDNIKLTVANGVQLKNVARPRIDVSGGLSANGNAEARKKTSLNEMSEVSYINMVESGTYSVSQYSIGHDIQKKYGYRTTDNDGSQTLFWDAKPNSFAVDDEKTYYIYNVIVVDISYRPMYGTYETPVGLQTGADNPAIFIKDRLFLIKTSSGFKIIKRIENYMGHFCTSYISVSSGLSCNKDSYKWIDMTAYKKEKLETYQSSSGKFVPYYMADQAEYFTSMKFKSDRKFESFHIYDSIESLMGTKGVQILSQKSISRGRSFLKIFTGSAANGESSHFSQLNAYGLYSDHKLTYEELLSKINTNNMYFSSSIKMPSVIPDDSSYAIDKVKVFVAGKPDKLSVNVDFKPSFNEEGKKSFIFMLLYDN